MANQLQTSLPRQAGENEVTWLTRIIKAIKTDIEYIASLFNKTYSGIFINGDGDTVTVDRGLIVSVDPAPPTFFKLTWDAIGNALYTDIADYNALLGSDFTTLTVDGNDQLLTGNSTTFAMPANTFNGNTNIVAVDDTAESCTSVGYNAFRDCAALTSLSFPVCTSLGENAFNSCAALTTASFPVCTSVGESAFSGCTSLTTASYPACTTVGSVAFNGCTSLTTATFPACTSVNTGAFNDCTALTTVSLPLCADLGGTTGNDDVFKNISGNTITLTIPVSRQTCDGGNPDGDIVYLSANNTATIIYV